MVLRYAVSVFQGGVIAALLCSLAWADTVSDKQTVPQAMQQHYPAWQGQSALQEVLTVETAFPKSAWWVSFQDADLTRYIETALKNNPNLAASADRVEAARAQARIAFSRELPNLGVGANYTRQKFSGTLSSPSVRQLQTGGGQTFSPGRQISFYNVPVQASYEVDLWQRNRLTTRAQNQRLQASEWQQKAAETALAAEVAAAYFNLLKADALTALQTQLVEKTQASFQVENLRYQAGLITEDQVRTEDILYAQSQADLEEYRRLQQFSLHQLAYLMGTLPTEAQALTRRSLDEVVLPGVVEAGLPSELIARRPDIQAREALLEATNLDVRAARREFLPAITLNADFGFASVDWRKLFNWQSHLYSYGGQLVQALFTGGRRRATVRLNKALAMEQLHLYHDELFNAFREVEDSMASLSSRQRALADTQQKLASFDQRLRLQTVRASQGLIAPADVIPTQIEQLTTRQQYMDLKANTLIDVINLYQSLGGGAS